MVVCFPRDTACTQRVANAHAREDKKQSRWEQVDKRQMDKRRLRHAADTLRRGRRGLLRLWPLASSQTLTANYLTKTVAFWGSASRQVLFIWNRFPQNTYIFRQVDTQIAQLLVG
eukprot:9212247-Heterocapsa_arctica.AAC.1